MKGRIASLLEVGTGFHPELTGRENIYLNGAILGMTTQEMKRKFDEIVAFAEVEKFVDTPVKRYSSGMYVRLAFAVAAHLEPEILLVDEVLAVGDAEFQKKCLGKMGEVAKEGRTVLFVSHNLSMIRKLCPQSIFLNNGYIYNKGFSDDVIFSYTNNFLDTSIDIINFRQTISDLPRDPIFELLDIKVIQNNRISNYVGNGDPVEIHIEYIVHKETFGLRIFFDLLDQTDIILFRSFNDDAHETIPIMKQGRYLSKVIIPANWLAPTTYYIQIGAGIHNVRMVLPLNIRLPLFVQANGIVNRAYTGDHIRGRLLPALKWNTILNN